MRMVRAEQHFDGDRSFDLVGDRSNIGKWPMPAMGDLVLIWQRWFAMLWSA